MVDPLEDCWNRPDPTDGDEEPARTYQAVGEFMTGCKQMEFNISTIYARLKDPTPYVDSYREYGISGKIFEERLRALEKVAAFFFVSNPSQLIEGDLQYLLFVCRKLSKRRNEIAHGVVEAIHLNLGLNKPDEEGWTELTPRFYIVPPHHSYLKYGDDDQYYYCSQTMHSLSLTLQNVRKRLIGLGNHFEFLHGQKYSFGQFIGKERG